MAKHALLVGINDYPGGNQLHGCINDIDDMAAYLKQHHGFADADIETVRDKHATTKNILDALDAFVAGLAPGDRALFHYSGHGAQMPTKSDGEIDGLDEVICPVDFDFTDAHAIRDDDFNRIFSKVPKGVELVWISDSCHSGTLERLIVAPGGIRAKAREIPMPEHLRERVRAAARKKGKDWFLPKKLTAASKLNVALISGCRSDQTSADAEIDGRFNGAATYFLLKGLRKEPEAPLDQLVHDVDLALADAGYGQRPGTFGNHEIRQRAFLEPEALPV